MNARYLPSELDEVASHLKNGEVVAIPTETVYGLAASIQHPTAIERIFTLKNRPPNHPLIIHIAEMAALRLYARDIPDYVDELTRTFWPGPLTLILPRSKQVPLIVTGNQDTVGIRLPNHPLTRKLINLVGSPLAAPSANLFGSISPTTAQHVLEEFSGRVPVLDGGSCAVGIESTIIDATLPRSCTLLRPGRITLETLTDTLPGIAVFGPQSGNKQVSGTLKYHYAPKKPNILFHNWQQLNDIKSYYQHSVYIICINPAYLKAKEAGVKMSNQPEEYAQKLYDQLRLADCSPCKAIAIEAPPQENDWHAIRDRISRSTAKSMEQKDLIFSC